MKRFFLLAAIAFMVGFGLLALNADATPPIKPITPKDIKKIEDLKITKDKDKDKKDKKDKDKKDKDKTKDKDKGTGGAGKEKKSPAEVINGIKDIIQAIRGGGPGGPGGGGGDIGGGGGGGFGGGEPATPSDSPFSRDDKPAPKSARDDEPINDDPPMDEPSSKGPKNGKDDKTPKNTKDEPLEEPASKDTDKSTDKEPTEEGEREQPFTRRFLRVKNDTEGTIKVYVQFRGLEGKKWTWTPANPSESQDALVFEVRPGQDRYLTYKGERISASRVRLWAVGGEQTWLDHQDRDLWLVPEIDRGEHRYLATEMQTHTSTFGR